MPVVSLASTTSITTVVLIGLSIAASLGGASAAERKWAQPGQEVASAAEAPTQPAGAQPDPYAQFDPFARIGRLGVSPVAAAPIASRAASDPVTGAFPIATFAPAAVGFGTPGLTAATAPAPTQGASGQPAEPPAPFQLGIPAAPNPAAAAPAAASVPALPAKEAIDLTALKYYAAKNDIARVAAEIRRIRTQNPDWLPPETLFAEQKTAVDEQPMWDLYATGKLDEIYRLIEAQKSADPSYVPSSDLIDKLKQAEARRAISAAMKTRNWTQVLGIAQQMPELLVCQEMQVLWDVGEAFSHTNVPERAFALYGYILSNCEDRNERLATIQKASQTLPDQATARLMQFSRASFDGSGEFDSVVLDKLRGKVGEAIENRVGQRPTDEDLQRLQNLALSQGNADDSMLLGWYYFSRNDYATAKDWFNRVLQVKFDLKALEGYILALRENKELDEARETALEYSRQDYSIAKLYIEIVASELTDEDPTPVPAATLMVLQNVIDEHKSALGAQSLAWYLYNNKDPKTAVEWFEKSVGWEPTPEGVLGLAIAQNKLGNRTAVKELAGKYGTEFPTLNAFVTQIGPDPSARGARGGAQRGGGGAPARRGNGGGGGGEGGDPLMREALAAYEKENYGDAIAKLDARRARRGETRDVSVLRGWAMYNSGKTRDAYQLFTRLEHEKSTRDSRKGAYVAWQRMMPPRFR